MGSEQPGLFDACRQSPTVPPSGIVGWTDDGKGGVSDKGVPNVRGRDTTQKERLQRTVELCHRGWRCPEVLL
jgi:hypothetical protein